MASLVRAPTPVSLTGASAVADAGFVFQFDFSSLPNTPDSLGRSWREQHRTLASSASLDISHTLNLLEDEPGAGRV